MDQLPGCRNFEPFTQKFDMTINLGNSMFRVKIQSQNKSSELDLDTAIVIMKIVIELCERKKKNLWCLALIAKVLFLFESSSNSLRAEFEENRD